MTKILRRITAKRIRSWYSCWGEGDEIENLFRKYKVRSATPLQIALCKDVSVEDRLWLLLRSEIIPECELRLFACWCASMALRAERAAGREPDRRSWEAIRVTRQYARGLTTAKELSAARSAAEDAAWSAAESAEDAAWSAVESAAESAEDAAWSAAESAEDAARSAAEDATWSAARSAAWSATWSAAESAAGSAAGRAHLKQLCRILRKLEIG